MALSSRDRVLYARHLLLPEIGSAGQERLCASWVDVPSHADHEANSVALDYLKRAGVKVRSAADDLGLQRSSDLPVSDRKASESGSHMIEAPVADAAAVQVLAGAPELRHAAAALLGAFAATEVIKQATGCGKPATFPALLSFVSEDA